MPDAIKVINEDELTDEEWEDECCICDFDEVENCPVHYPIDDGSEDDDDCMDCGTCDACIEQSRAYAEQMEIEYRTESKRP